MKMPKNARFSVMMPFLLQDGNFNAKLATLVVSYAFQIEFCMSTVGYIVLGYVVRASEAMYATGQILLVPGLLFCPG